MYGSTLYELTQRNILYIEQDMHVLLLDYHIILLYYYIIYLYIDIMNNNAIIAYLHICVYIYIYIYIYVNKYIRIMYINILIIY